MLVPPNQINTPSQSTQNSLPVPSGSEIFRLIEEMKITVDQKQALSTAAEALFGGRKSPPPIPPSPEELDRNLDKALAVFRGNVEFEDIFVDLLDKTSLVLGAQPASSPVNPVVQTNNLPPPYKS